MTDQEQVNAAHPGDPDAPVDLLPGESFIGRVRHKRNLLFLTDMRLLQKSWTFMGGRQDHKILFLENLDSIETTRRLDFGYLKIAVVLWLVTIPLAWLSVVSRSEGLEVVAALLGVGSLVFLILFAFLKTKTLTFHSNRLNLALKVGAWKFEAMTRFMHDVQEAKVSRKQLVDYTDEQEE